MNPQVMESFWWEVIAPDPDDLAGESFLKFLDIVLQEVKVDTVAVVEPYELSRMIGYPRLKKDALPIIPLEDFRKALRPVYQFDWAEFYFTQGKEAAEGMALSERRIFSISKSTFALLGLDNTYICLYTQSEAAVRRLEKEFEDVQSSHGTLNSFEYLRLT